MLVLTPGAMQEKNMLKNGIRIIRKKDLYYIVKSEHKVKRFKPWLGDSFSFLYDFIMKNSIFPKKFGGDISKHHKLLSQELKGIHGKRVLELATGSGSAVNFLPNDNQYSGTDISPGLLRIAVKNFRDAGFKKAEFYVTSAENLPFDDSIFSICLCILSLNFFDKIKKVFQEVKRVLVPGGAFVCSVPVPERNKLKSKIRGTLYSEAELSEICKEYGFKFESLPFKNGALLYFKAFLQ
jgi:ubiquinone/menaquinone biosynthesis C-methylase UbiE